VFPVIMSANYAVYGLGFIVAGPLTDSVGPRWVFGAVGVVLALASVVAYAMSRGAESSVELLDEAEAA
jgi:MFS family permease